MQSAEGTFHGGHVQSPHRGVTASYSSFHLPVCLFTRWFTTALVHTLGSSGTVNVLCCRGRLGSVRASPPGGQRLDVRLYGPSGNSVCFDVEPEGGALTADG